MKSSMKLPKFFLFIMRYVTPTYLAILLAVWFFQDGINVFLMKGAPPENYPYIWFARFLLTGILITVIVAVRIAWQRKHYIQHHVP